MHGRPPPLAASQRRASTLRERMRVFRAHLNEAKIRRSRILPFLLPVILEPSPSPPGVEKEPTVGGGGPSIVPGG